MVARAVLLKVIYINVKMLLVAVLNLEEISPQIDTFSLAKKNTVGNIDRELGERVSTATQTATRRQK
jgi:hypothetical protein